MFAIARFENNYLCIETFRDLEDLSYKLSQEDYKIVTKLNELTEPNRVLITEGDTDYLLSELPVSLAEVK